MRPPEDWFAQAKAKYGPLLHSKLLAGEIRVRHVPTIPGPWGAPPRHVESDWLADLLGEVEIAILALAPFVWDQADAALLVEVPAMGTSGAISFPELRRRLRCQGKPNERLQIEMRTSSGWEPNLTEDTGWITADEPARLATWLSTLQYRNGASGDWQLGAFYRRHLDWDAAFEIHRGLETVETRAYPYSMADSGIQSQRTTRVLREVKTILAAQRVLVPGPCERCQGRFPNSYHWLAKAPNPQGGRPGLRDKFCPECRLAREREQTRQRVRRHRR